MIHLCIDARMINNSGIGVYLKNYTEYILKKDIFRITLIGNKKELYKYFDKYSNWSLIESDVPIYSIREQIELYKMVPYCDIFWSPHYNVPILPIKAKKRLVTIPDTAHLTLGDFLGFGVIKRLYAKYVFMFAVKKSDQITTISNFSKDEIKKYSNIDSNKIRVIYLGIDKYLFTRIEDKKRQNIVKLKYNLPQEYVLYVGNVKPNKNLVSLVDGFAHIMHKNPNLNIVIVGKKDGFITNDMSIFEKVNQNANIESRVFFTGYVETEDLPVLYTLAKMFVFPSIYEGFGFPPLEAMACGCPVIASNVTSIPEVCEDAVIYIDPKNPIQIGIAIDDLNSNINLRELFVEKGYFRFKKYDWTVSSEDFIQTILSMV